eukprot:CAMPEP_0203865160 /NCGR_PEP_ID=MMETSP0359-20131031/15195_1 /ASSEMBLY_ACC=CAM_ASM_000338 /TAXON_ID=268821 /ORGANISM="Scrippsiella Hangoei, Strain SHTV-5" /LENGTH=106 /DNA_ID=CAMNT_0050783037 /DNA_START=50 /DNA_END=370 /DNA_ORIENTATION=+
MASSDSEISSSDDMQVEELPDHSQGGWLGLSSWRITGWFSQPTEDEGSASRIVLDGRCLCIGQCVCRGPGDPSGGLASVRRPGRARGQRAEGPEATPSEEVCSCEA